jgi:hypothetical protein
MKLLQVPAIVRPVVADTTAPFCQNRLYQFVKEPTLEQELIVNSYRKQSSNAPPVQANTVPVVHVTASSCTLKFVEAVKRFPVVVEVIVEIVVPYPCRIELFENTILSDPILISPAMRYLVSAASVRTPPEAAGRSLALSTITVFPPWILVQVPEPAPSAI